jgi:hypothetical protein
MEIILDKTKPFSECKGERQPDDPDYRVCFRQGEKINKKMILLPFGADLKLIPDDGRTEPWQAKDADGKPVTHYPLWNDDMRALLAKKLERLSGLDKKAQDEEHDADHTVTVTEDVNFALWLQGQARYPWDILQAAARKRFSRVYQTKREMVIDLVLDERVVPEEQVAPDLATLLPAVRAES